MYFLYAASMIDSLPPDFAIAVERSGPRAVLSLSGELDLSGEAEVAPALDHVVASGARTVVIDLRELTFIDSSGIRALIAAQRRCAAARCPLYVVPGPAPVRRVLALCGVEERFALLDDPADAPNVGALL